MGNLIYVLPDPCYLATKFEAFNNRGNDYRTSHDFEDIIYVFDNRVEIVEEILSAPFEIKNFIKSQLIKLENYKYYNEVLIAHIHPMIQFERMPLLKDKIHKVTHST